MERLKKDVLKNVDRAYRQLNRYSKEYQEEDLHDFRLHIKQLKAFHSFVGSAVFEGSEAKLYQKIMKFYKFAGKFREAHVMRENLKTMGIDLNLYTPISLDQDKFAQKMEAAKLSLKKLYRNLKKLDMVYNPYQLWMYCQGMIDQAFGVLKTEKPGKAWHQSRNKLKFAVFLSKSLPGQLRLCVDKKMLKKMGTLLGQYQDLCDMQRFVQRQSRPDAEFLLGSIAFQKEQCVTQIKKLLEKINV